MSQDPSRDPPEQPAVPLAYATPPPPNAVDLRAIALRQKAVMYCILAYIALAALRIAAISGVPIGAELFILLRFLGLAVIMTAAVFVFMLALSLYSTAIGILLGILTLIPLVGLIVLLVINGRATRVLQRHGIRVGLLGAKSSQIPPPGAVVIPR